MLLFIAVFVLLGLLLLWWAENAPRHSHGAGLGPGIRSLVCAADDTAASHRATSLPSARPAQTVRAVIVARLIDGAEAGPALGVRIDAGLIDRAIAERALQEAETTTLAAIASG